MLDILALGPQTSCPQTLCETPYLCMLSLSRSMHCSFVPFVSKGCNTLTLSLSPSLPLSFDFHDISPSILFHWLSLSLSFDFSQYLSPYFSSNVFSLMSLSSFLTPLSHDFHSISRPFSMLPFLVIPFEF